MEAEISFRIILEQPPVGVDFALQKGKGNVFETIQKQRSAGNRLYFEFQAGVKKSKEGLPDFNGPFVQGPSGSRFVYLDIGTIAGQFDSVWSRRLKIPLSGISWPTINQSKAGVPVLLETTVAGTGKDGGPTCGTIKPFNGWKQLTAS